MHSGFSPLSSEVQRLRLDSDSQRDAAPFFRADCSLPRTPSNITTTQYTAMSAATTHEPTEITSSQRPGIRRGPRVSSACVNCRRRKVHSYRPVSDLSRVGTDIQLCVAGEMYRRQAAVPVLHNLPETLRLRRTRQASKVSIAVCRQLSYPLSRTSRLTTRLTTQTNPRPRRAAGRRTPPAQGLIISVTATG